MGQSGYFVNSRGDRAARQFMNIQIDTLLLTYD